MIRAGSYVCQGHVNEKFGQVCFSSSCERGVNLNFMLVCSSFFCCSVPGVASYSYVVVKSSSGREVVAVMFSKLL